MEQFIVFPLFLLIGLCFAFLTTGFWVWTLVDCLVHEPSEGNEKIVWAVVIAILHVMGAALYFFIRRPERIQQYGH